MVAVNLSTKHGITLNCTTTPRPFSVNPDSIQVQPKEDGDQREDSDLFEVFEQIWMDDIHSVGTEITTAENHAMNPGIRIIRTSG
jgi:hypothetical protein